MAALYSMPSILTTYDQLPANMQSFLLYQLLRRTPRPILQFATQTMLPVLQRDFVSELPVEVSHHILKFMDTRSLCRASCVSRRWQDVVNGDAKVWRARLSDARVLPPAQMQCRRADGACDGAGGRVAAHGPVPVPTNAFKEEFARDYVLDRNWHEGKCRHISFVSEGGSVVTCVQLTDDYIIAGFDTKNIYVYDITTGATVRQLVGHEGGVWALAVVGNTVISGSTDRTVRIWDLETGRCTHVFAGHSSTVRCLQVLLPTDTRTPLERARNEPVRYEPSEPLIVTGSRDTTLRVWKLPSPTKDTPYVPRTGAEMPPPPRTNPYFMRVLEGHTDSVRAVAGFGNLVVSGSYDFAIRVWNVVTGQCLHVLEGHTAKVYTLALDTNLHLVISGSLDGTIRVWDWDTGACVRILRGHLTLVGLLALDHNTLVSAGADATLRVWDHPMQQPMPTHHTNAITCFQHDGTKIVSGADGTVKLWDVRTGAFVRDLLSGLSGVWQVRFDRRRCVAAVHRNDVSFFEVMDFGAEPEC
ncbi:WD40 repeat-like protein [Linderina pennispora]|uniref:WD40 repeat-like protein n=1 Tax=Linderina pennispora TaxID=61395 RepID=A0A1Y1VYT1_9FUNG|nr:WD40 repeat-like protein [Linderina pennispora]ORX66428.1 WD40 repeat-like protein [Linderina pennispora]